MRVLPFLMVSDGFGATAADGRSLYLAAGPSSPARARQLGFGFPCDAIFIYSPCIDLGYPSAST